MTSSIRVARLVEHVLRIVVLPEAVVHAVEADLDELEVVPLRVLQEVPHDLEMLAAHRVDLVLEPLLVAGAKSLDVDRILADQRGDLRLRRGRMRVDVRGGVGGEKAAHADAVHLARRETTAARR